MRKAGKRCNVCVTYASALCCDFLGHVLICVWARRVCACVRVRVRLQLVRDLEHERTRISEPGARSQPSAAPCDFDMCEMGPPTAARGAGLGGEGEGGQGVVARDAASLILKLLDDAGYLEIMSLKSGRASFRHIEAGLGASRAAAGAGARSANPHTNPHTNSLLVEGVRVEVGGCVDSIHGALSLARELCEAHEDSIGASARASSSSSLRAPGNLATRPSVSVGSARGSEHGSGVAAGASRPCDDFFGALHRA